MVAARSAAMAFNRLVDADLDARNPRTRMRHLPAGLLSRGFAWGFVAVSSAVFLFCRRPTQPALPAPGAAGPGRRLLLFLHQALHLLLPPGAWLLAWASLPPPPGSPCAGSLDPRILWLTAAVTFWTAGFDVIYACQDYEFDCAEGARGACRGLLGIAGALCGSPRLLHVLMVGCLLALVCALHLGALALAGVGAIAALLIYEHSLVKAHDLSRVECGLLHHERLGERVILFILGRRYLPPPTGCLNHASHHRRLRVWFPSGEKVEAGERLSFEDGVALYRTTDILARRLPGQPGARAPARQRHVFQRQPPHQPHRRLRGQLPPVRFRQARARSQGLHHVARRGVAARRRRLERGGHRVPHRGRPASRADARLVLRDAARPEAALPAASI